MSWPSASSWWVMSGVVVLVLWGSRRLWAVEPLQVTISKETTYITEPLTDEGLPDYRRAWLELERKHKVPAAENGAVAFYQVVGLENVDEQYHQAFCDELGMPLPDSASCLQSLVDESQVRKTQIWLLQQRGEQVDSGSFEAFQATHFELAYEAYEGAIDLLSFPLQANIKPAAVRGIPPIEAWLTANNAKLDQVVEAINRPGWYEPSPDLCGQNPQSGIIGVSRPMTMRGVVQCLAFRARYRVAANDLRGAMGDLQAIHRYSTRWHSQTYVDLLMQRGMVVLYALPVEQLLLDRQDVSDELLQELQTLYPPKVPASSISQLISGGERICTLDFLIKMLRKQLPQSELQLCWSEEGQTLAKRLLKYPIDADYALKRVNQQCDQFAEAAAIDDFAESIASLKSADLDPLSAEQLQASRAEVAKLTPQQRADWLVRIPCFFEENFALQFRRTEAYRTTQSQLMHLALGLARYRNARGKYPEHLAELVPTYVTQLPADPYGNREWGYRTTEGGYLLYSYGENRTDDAGSNNQYDTLQGYATGANDAQLRELLGDGSPGRGVLKGYILVRSDDVAIRLPLLEQPAVVD